MELYSEFITPAELTGYAREALADRPVNQFILSDYMPYRPVNDLVYRFTRGSGAGLLEAASYRAYDAEPKFGSREGISRVTGELPPIGQQYVLGEYDQLRLRNAGEEIRSIMLRDAVRITRQIETRLEFARADALVNGSVTLAEDGVYATVDFARSAAHSVTASVAWSDHTNSLPLDDLQTWADTYADTNGERPGTILTSTKVRGHLLRNLQIGHQVFPTVTTPPAITVTNLNQVLADFDLPEIRVFDARAKRLDTATNTVTTQRFIPDDRVLFLPANPADMGATMWGVTAEAMEPEYGIAAGDQPGIVVGAFKQKTTPVRVFTIGAAIALPILANPDLSFVADVL